MNQSNPDTHNSVNPQTPIAPTPWAKVLLLFAAGCTLSLNMGKVPPALPAIAESLSLSLLSVGWVVSIFGAIIACLGFPLAMLAARQGYQRSVMFGLLLSVIAGWAGSNSETLGPLLFFRALEGTAWLLVAVSMPLVMTALAKPRDRPVVLGIWGAFVPTGMIAAMLYTPPLLAYSSWQQVWKLTATITAVATVVVWMIIRQTTPPVQPRIQPSVIGEVVWRAAPLAMAGCFICYSALYVMVAAFIPLILIEQHELNVALASLLGALVIIGNALGNICAGWLIRAGVSRYSLLYFAMVSMGCLATPIYFEPTPLAMKVVCGFFFVSIGGLVPGTLFASAPLVVLTSAHIVLVNGLIMQGAGLGQFLGPISQTFLVAEGGSWSYAIAAALLFAIAGLISTWFFQRSGPIPLTAPSVNKGRPD